MSTGVRYSLISYSPQKHISQLSDYREWENLLHLFLYSKTRYVTVCVVVVMRVVLIVTMVCVGLVTANLDSERETDVSVSQILIKNIRAPDPRMYTVSVHDVLAL